MSPVAAYSAMTVYIMPGAELHIYNKFPALKKGINCPVQKSKMRAILMTACFLKDPREHNLIDMDLLVNLSSNSFLIVIYEHFCACVDKCWFSCMPDSIFLRLSAYFHFVVST